MLTPNDIENRVFKKAKMRYDIYGDVMNKLKEMPNDFLPRERLLKYGKESLADYEILAILLRTGTKGLNVLELSKYILTNKINMKDFANISINELKNIENMELRRNSVINKVDVLDENGKSIMLKSIFGGKSNE